MVHHELLYLTVSHAIPTSVLIAGRMIIQHFRFAADCLTTPSPGCRRPSPARKSCVNHDKRVGPIKHRSVALIVPSDSTASPPADVLCLPLKRLTVVAVLAYQLANLLGAQYDLLSEVFHLIVLVARNLIPVSEIPFALIVCHRSFLLNGRKSGGGGIVPAL